MEFIRNPKANKKMHKAVFRNQLVSDPRRSVKYNYKTTPSGSRMEHVRERKGKGRTEGARGPEGFHPSGQGEKWDRTPPETTQPHPLTPPRGR